MNMARFLVVLILTAISTTSAAFDFGKLIKDVTKETPEESSTDSSDKKKQTGLADLGGVLGETPVKEEVAIGREIAGRLLGASPLEDDNKLQQYVNQVGSWVAARSDRPELRWHFGVIASEDINAFAAPGGYILVTKGLYKKLNNEAELAGVLAHEIGHVIKKHHLKILKQGKLIDMGSGLIRSKADESQQGQTIGKLIGSGAEILARGLDKNAEYEADRVAVVLATRAGYDSYSLPAVLQEIGHVGADDSSVSLLFKTHPHPDVRLNKLGDAMGEKFDQYEGKLLASRFYRLKK
ncbi:MAG: peptidase [Gammaproteobacteria bacterium]|nr:MAG: peptidase [Gammaproteobacteria bacterium]